MEAYRVESKRDVDKMSIFKNELLSGIMRIIPPDDIELFRYMMSKLNELRGTKHKDVEKSIDDLIKEHTSPRCPTCTG